MIPRTRFTANIVYALVTCSIFLTTCSESSNSSQDSDHDPADDYTLYEAAERLDSDAEHLDSGEIVCEGHGFAKDACVALGCCTFEDDECWSAVGPRPCVSAKEDTVLFGELKHADMIDEKTMSIREAQVYCNKLPRCLGFTFEGPVPKDAKHLTIHFKSESSLGRPGWTTFLHKGIEASPNIKPVYRFRGKLKSLDSQPPLEPELLYTGAILNLIGTTFREVTQNPEKDVLVNLYAPWCGFCQKFKRPYGELARTLRHVETLQITQMDATQNHVADFPVNSFPTVVLFPAGEKKDQPLRYTGNRQPADMTHWLHRHATHSGFADDPPATATADDEDSDGILGENGDL